jgi:GGDEF domain-containing protein
MHEPGPCLTHFLDYHEDALQQILALGLTAAQVEALRPYGLLATDNVTGFHEGRSGSGRIATLRRSLRYAAQTDRECDYVEMDVVNLGGLNARLGHAGANEVYAALAAVVRVELSAVASAAVFFRHGGDEVSVFLLGTSEPAVVEAFKQINRKAAELARRHGVHDAPHPKHPDDRRYRGTGVRFGLVRLLPEYESDPARVFRLADDDVKRREPEA